MNKFIPSLALGALMAFNTQAAEDPDFNYNVDRFADIEVLRYEVPGFSDLTPEMTFGPRELYILEN